jgi:hypothetical protein
MAVETLIQNLAFPWSPVTGEDERKALNAELARETAPMHPLYHVGAMALAQRVDCNDVAFLLPCGRIAAVRLTWSSAEEPDGLPDFVVHETRDLFIIATLAQAA